MASGWRTKVFSEDFSSVAGANQKLGNYVPHPTIIVVGPESSGKSALIKSLTGISWTKNPKHTVGHVTEITCTADVEDSEEFRVWTKANESPNDPSQYSLRFCQDFSEGTFSARVNKIYPQIVNHNRDDVANAAGVLQKVELGDNVLCVNLRGPHDDHFRIIDVPGTWGNAEPSVRERVEVLKGGDPTITLVVTSCDADETKQHESVSSGKEMGGSVMYVWTNPDKLGTAARDSILTMLKDNNCHVVYCKPHEDGSTTTERHIYDDHFSAGSWSEYANTKDSWFGMNALRERIVKQLVGPAVSRLPLQSTLGTRSLTDVASAFAIEYEGCIGQVHNPEGFFKNPSMMPGPAVEKLLSIFQTTVERKGHSNKWSDEEEISFSEKDTYTDSFSCINRTDLPKPYFLWPAKNPKDQLRELIEGECEKILHGRTTFDLVQLDSMFLEQSENWVTLGANGTNVAMCYVRDFIKQTLDYLTRSKELGKSLWARLQKDLENIHNVLRDEASSITHEVRGITERSERGSNENLENDLREWAKEKGVDAAKPIEVLNPAGARDNNVLITNTSDFLKFYYNKRREIFVKEMTSMMRRRLLEDNDSPLRVFTRMVTGLNDLDLLYIFQGVEGYDNERVNTIFKLNDTARQILKDNEKFVTDLEE